MNIDALNAALRGLPAVYYAELLPIFVAESYRAGCWRLPDGARLHVATVEASLLAAGGDP